MIRVQSTPYSDQGLVQRVVVGFQYLGHYKVATDLCRHHRYMFRSLQIFKIFEIHPLKNLVIWYMTRLYISLLLMYNSFSNLSLLYK